MDERTTVDGFAESLFGDIASVFARLVAAQSRGGAALSIYHREREVVRLRAGDYPSNAQQLVFSVSKLVLSIALHRAAGSGIIDLDARLSNSWPELDRTGTAQLTLRDVLAHRTGLARFEQPISLETLLSSHGDEAIARQDPDPSPHHAYHAVTFGTLIDGALRRSAGISAAELVRSQVVEPLGLDIHLGLTEDQVRAVRPVQFSSPATIEDKVVAANFVAPRDEALVALLNDPEIFNTAQFLSAGLPSLGMVATAPSLARLLASTLWAVDGVRILTAAQREAMCTPQSSGLDDSLGIRTVFGSGVQLPFAQLPWTGPMAFGHEGAGGSAAFADPELEIAVGFTTDLFPRSVGASPTFLALLPTIRNLALAG